MGEIQRSDRWWDGKLDIVKLGDYVEENRAYNPVIYKAAKLSNWFGEPKIGYDWYDGEEGLKQGGIIIWHHRASHQQILKQL